MIPITKPFLPPAQEYHEMIEGIWKRQWLTNMGPLASELEMSIKDKLGVKHLLYVTNGTIALQMAIRTLNLEGEVITTPFSFVATTSSIVWENCKPIFVDIDKKTLNIDASKIEDAITEKTTAILATHVYGNPCDVDSIEKIARKHKLKVIYDGAHAFGVNCNDESIFNYGDISTLSLHATKLFHSTEGGMVFTKDPNLLKEMAHMRNFGFLNSESFYNLGINGKNSEFHAAMGLVNLNYTDKIHDKRKLLTQRYDHNLKQFKAVKPKWDPNSTKNFAYYPLIIESEELLLDCLAKLKAREIYCRRYFYPSLATSLPYLESYNLEVTDDVSKRVICLPLYFDLTLVEVDLICRILLRTQNN